MNIVRSGFFAMTAVVAASSSCNCDEELYSTPGSLRGVVCSTVTGQPIGDVAVVINDGTGKAHDGTTDAFGQYRAENLAVGDGTVVINEPGVDARTLPVTIDSTTEAELIDTACRAPTPPPPPPSGTVSGCVCDEAVGAWVTGANVFVLTSDGGVVVTGTDEVGCFTLEGVPEGVQTVKIEKGIFFEEHAITIVAGETLALPAIESCALDPPPPPGEVGTITGRVCAPDGETWLAGADAYITLPNGSRVATVTDVDGNYTLENVPVGSHDINIVKGSFEATVPTTVVAGQTTVIPEAECQIEAEHLKIAVVTGDYDRVQDVLSGIGIDETDVDVFDSNYFDDGWIDTLLADYAALSQYDIVFLNCGLGDIGFTARFFGANDSEIGDNLRRFVSEGGSIYASDWAYHVVEKTWPDFVAFRGADDVAQSAKVGFAPQDVPATITDPAMALALGQNTMEIHYPLGAWAAIEDVAPSTTVYIRGDADIDEDNDGVVDGALTNVPHTVAFRPGSGRVLFTSFHQEPGINPDMQRVLQLLIFEL